MKTGRCALRSTAAALFATVAALAAAAERVPVQRPSEDTSISAAGRQFDSVKAGSASSDPAAKGATPRVSLPPLNVAGEPAPVAPAASATPLQETTSANWLVDAMMKHDTARRPKGGDPAGRDSFTQTGRRSDSARGHEESSGSRRQGSSEPHERGPRANADNSQKRDASAGPAYNPLDRYMADWLSPQETALRRSLEGFPTRGGAGDRVTMPTGRAPDIQGASVAAAPDVLASTTRGSLAGANRHSVENPYLQTFTAPPPAVVVAPANTGSQLQQPATVAAPPMPPPLVVQPAPRSAVPPFVKPVSQEKYFKPLKRF